MASVDDERLLRRRRAAGGDRHRGLRRRALLGQAVGHLGQVGGRGVQHDRSGRRGQRGPVDAGADVGLDVRRARAPRRRRPGPRCSPGRRARRRTACRTRRPRQRLGDDGVVGQRVARDQPGDGAARLGLGEQVARHVRRAGRRPGAPRRRRRRAPGSTPARPGRRSPAATPASTSRARTVSSAGSPGPLPTKAMRPTELGARFIVPLPIRQCGCSFRLARRPCRAARRRVPLRASRRRPCLRLRRRAAARPPRVPMPSTARSESRSTARPSSSRSETTSASAATGQLQPASRVASTARSAVTAARVNGSSSAAASIAGEAGFRPAALDRQRPLCGGGQHLQRVEQLVRLLDAAEPAQPGRGDDDGVQLAGVHLADPGVDVAADRHDLEAQPERVQLGGPPRRAGADAHTAAAARRAPARRGRPARRAGPPAPAPRPGSAAGPVRWAGPCRSAPRCRPRPRPARPAARRRTRRRRARRPAPIERSPGVRHRDQLGLVPGGAQPCRRRRPTGPSPAFAAGCRSAGRSPLVPLLGRGGPDRRRRAGRRRVSARPRGRPPHLDGCGDRGGRLRVELEQRAQRGGVAVPVRPLGQPLDLHRRRVQQLVDDAADGAGRTPRGPRRRARAAASPAAAARRR